MKKIQQSTLMRCNWEYKRSLKKLLKPIFRLKVHINQWLSISKFQTINLRNKVKRRFNLPLNSIQKKNLDKRLKNLRKRKLLNKMRKQRLMQGRKRLLQKLLRSKRPSKKQQQNQNKRNSKDNLTNKYSKAKLKNDKEKNHLW